MQPDLPGVFLFLNQLQISFAEKKMRLKKCDNYAPPPFSKFLATPLPSRHFFTLSLHSSEF